MAECHLSGAGHRDGGGRYDAVSLCRRGERQTFYSENVCAHICPRNSSSKWCKARRSRDSAVPQGIRTAYFTDIASFSSFSEILSATKLVELLNEYLTAMTDILLAEGGTLDKYEGDAIVAFFGAPMPQQDHAARALRVALGMQRGTGAVARTSGATEGDKKWPEIVTADAHAYWDQLGGHRHRQHGLYHAHELHHDGRRGEHGGASRGVSKAVWYLHPVYRRNFAAGWRG